MEKLKLTDKNKERLEEIKKTKIDLPKEKIDLIFEIADKCFFCIYFKECKMKLEIKSRPCQYNYLNNLYKIAFKDLNKELGKKGWKIINFPKVSEETWSYICQKAIDFDNNHYKGVLNGGLWMNRGFGKKGLENWFIILEDIEIIIEP